MRKGVDAALKLVGGTVAFIIAVLLSLIFITSVLRFIESPPLLYGVITNKSFYDGHPYTDTFTIGPYSFTKMYGDGKPHYEIEVTGRDGHTDWWEVPEGIWREAEIGTEIRKSDIGRRNP
ncbi:MAG: hypothetical protein IKM73_07820 [Acidaminococcaceae bacterium]|nr:hypothetical protein [Acidaminococcaceae bacterium]